MEKSLLKIASVYNSNRTSVQCVYRAAASMFFLLLLSSGVAVSFCPRGNCDAITWPREERYVMLQWVSLIGLHYIILSSNSEQQLPQWHSGRG